MQPKKIPDGEVNETEDLPISVLAEMANRLIEQGHNIFLKFTCEQCGARLGFDVPNVFYKRGSCDKCGHITEIKYGGLMVAYHFQVDVKT